MNKKIFTLTALIILTAIFGFFAWLVLGSGDTYYTQIDNTKMQQNTSEQGVINLTGNGGLACSYTLPTYNEKGREKAITFGASRELKEGAFISLSVMPVRGVLEWSEVTYDELPAAVRAHYTWPADVPN